MLKIIKNNRSKTPLPFTDDDYQDIFLLNESPKNAHNGIVPPGFPNNNIVLNTISGTPRPRSLNLLATPFYPDNFPSQNNDE